MWCYTNIKYIVTATKRQSAPGYDSSVARPQCFGSRQCLCERSRSSSVVQPIICAHDIILICYRFPRPSGLSLSIIHINNIIPRHYSLSVSTSIPVRAAVAMQSKKHLLQDEFSERKQHLAIIIILLVVQTARCVHNNINIISHYYVNIIIGIEWCTNGGVMTTIKPTTLPTLSCFCLNIFNKYVLYVVPAVI